MNLIYDQITDIQKLIRRNEEEVQYSMIKWNNLIIKHEKMNKISNEITLNLNVDQEKLGVIQNNISELKLIMT